ncbi:unnamed protein product [Rotaria sordida]|uniref:Uncharacterized protein n=1 Tax=Rotaria sordida TaxID=392033 RepID=A0A815HWZ6_9BILA|nr:unnamed protein product [Rotaria sordida]CAF1605933.1 unnamed protein product [Rotaria sordida]
MVVFHCGSCGEALKKNQVDKHIASTCRRVPTLFCIDCGKDFTKANDQTLTLDALKKKILKRYKKLKPNQAKEDDSLLKKLEKKIQRAPFVQQIEENVYRLSE